MYLDDWKEEGFLRMVADFEGCYDLEKAKELAKGERWYGVNVLLATYTYEDYSGSAFVLFERDGKLFEVNGSHCSCFGLGEQGWSSNERESQWEPEEVTVEALRKRFTDGTLGHSEGESEFVKELREALSRYEEANR